jgi:hypothetical protein
VKYKPFEYKKGLHEDLVTCMLNVQQLFSDYTVNIVQTVLGLCLSISSLPGEEVAHKAAVVPELLKGLDFLHKVELVRLFTKFLCGAGAYFTESGCRWHQTVLTFGG